MLVCIYGFVLLLYDLFIMAVDSLWNGKSEKIMLDTQNLHPRKLTWNLKRMVSKRNVLSQRSIFRGKMLIFGGVVNFQRMNKDS